MGKTENANIAPSEPMKEMITIQLHKDTGKCSQPLTVTINGVSTVIPRGIPVQVSKDVADVIEMKNMQDSNTVDLITRLANSFEIASEDVNK